jgi:hypothetical protein
LGANFVTPGGDNHGINANDYGDAMMLRKIAILLLLYHAVGTCASQATVAKPIHYGRQTATVTTNR